MKKIICSLSLCIFMIQCLLAQLKVASNGNVGIGISTTPLSALSINHPGEANFKMLIEGNAIVFQAQRYGSNPSSTWGRGAVGTSEISTIYGDIGVVGVVGSETPKSSGRAIGMQGIAYNATSGYNYGMVGALRGTNNGTGVFGTSNSSNYFGIHIPGRYAGYFEGDVKVTGTLTATTVSSSDIRYKNNIVSLGAISVGLSKSSSVNVLGTVLQMNPVQYNYKQVYFEPENDTTAIKQGFFDEKSQVFQKKQYGLIAQELQRIYPDLVYEDGNGYLSVNYTGIIPLLIQSVKELQAEIDELKNNDASMQKIAPENAGLQGGESGPASLSQNNPNPFSQSTQIKYYLPSTVATAYLCIYNLQGKQLKQYVITERGEGAKIISASEFAAGIYLYGLIADGKEIDVKRMILTE